MKISHVVFEQSGLKEVLLAIWKSPLLTMQTVFCYRSVLLYKLLGGGSTTSNIDKISEAARGIHAEVRLRPCVNWALLWIIWLKVGMAKTCFTESLSHIKFNQNVGYDP